DATTPEPTEQHPPAKRCQTETTLPSLAAADAQRLKVERRTDSGAFRRPHSVADAHHSHVHSAVDGPDRPGDERGLICDEEVDDTRDLIGAAQPSDGIVSSMPPSTSSGTCSSTSCGSAAWLMKNAPDSPGDIALVNA